jgi:tRNA U55 pseudouridine synthase TruB
VYELELVSRHADLLRLRIRCSKGTYVRQLAVDLGMALGTVAHLGALSRTAVAALRWTRPSRWTTCRPWAKKGAWPGCCRRPAA